MAKRKPKIARRESFFGQQVVRLMTKTCLANDLGPIAFTFLTVISAQQDAARGRPVTYWNKQLMSVTGLTTERQLRRVRQDCITAGWLKYENRGPRKAGLYRVVIPDRFADIPDTRCDEGSPPELSALEARNKAANGKPYTRAKKARNVAPNMARNQARDVAPNQAPNVARPPIPIPIPTPLSLREGERESLILSVAGCGVHDAEAAVDAALSRGCPSWQIEQQCKRLGGKALLTTLKNLRPPSAKFKETRQAETAEAKRDRIVLEGRRTGLSNKSINRMLEAEGCELIVET